MIPIDDDWRIIISVCAIRDNYTYACMELKNPLETKRHRNQNPLLSIFMAPEDLGLYIHRIYYYKLKNL